MNWTRSEAEQAAWEETQPETAPYWCPEHGEIEIREDAAPLCPDCDAELEPLT